MTNLCQNYLNSKKKTAVSDFRVGDTVRVYQEIEEGDKKRLQPFEGLVIARKHGNQIGATFTVRTRMGGIGTEKIFPLHSPVIKKIRVVKRAQRVAKAKLYWTRKKTDREIQKKLKLSQKNQQKQSGPKQKERISPKKTKPKKTS